jgi:lipopolysaccharide export LptBFGC system permease protein LptF
MIKNVRWLRVVIAAFLVEVGLVVTTLPFIPILGEELVFQAVVPSACLVVPFIVAWLATRKLPSGRVLHGLLIGVVATIMYFALVIGSSSIAEAAATYGVPLFIAVNALRMVSAAAGGYVSARGTAPSTA